MFALWIQSLSSFAMTVIIIMVQVVTYPQFKHVGQTALAKYATNHIASISRIVIPVMLVELLSLAWLWAYPPFWSLYLITASVLLASIWVITGIYLVPRHHQLANFGNTSAIAGLLSFNRIRTVLWIIKSIAVTGLLIVYLTPQMKHTYIAQATVDSDIARNGDKATINAVITPGQLTTALHGMHAQTLYTSGLTTKYIVRTPWMKFPDLLIVTTDSNHTILWSKSLIGRHDLNTNNRRLTTIQHRLNHSNTAPATKIHAKERAPVDS